MAAPFVKAVKRSAVAQQSDEPREVALKLTSKQGEFIDAIQSGKYSYLLYGGAIRGGKSVGGLAAIFLLCKVYPGSRWAVVRRELPTLRRNTIPTFERIRPKNFVGPINQSTWTARCANGSEIVFFAENYKQDKELERWKGLEVNGFLLEEANELTELSFNKAIERAGSWEVPDGEQPPPLVLLTCNPAKNWVKKFFYDPWKIEKLKAPWFYLPAKIFDNPHVDAQYLKSLEQLKITSPRAYERFVGGEWEGADDPDQVIEFEWVYAAMHDVEPAPGKRKMGVDVARFGADDSVWSVREGNVFLPLQYEHGLRIDRVADITQAKINELPVDASQVNIDTVGLGAGAADILVGRGFHVREFVAGAKMVERANADDGSKDSKFKFKNLRSQAWWEFREKLRKGERVLPNDPRLAEDLTAPHYRISGDRVIEVESKDEIKERIGRSTDAADAVVMCDFDMPGFRTGWKLAESETEHVDEHLALMTGFD